MTHGMAVELHPDPPAPVIGLYDVQTSECKPFVIVEHGDGTGHLPVHFSAEEPVRVLQPEALRVRKPWIPSFRNRPLYRKREFLPFHFPDLYSVHTVHQLTGY